VLWTSSEVNLFLQCSSVWRRSFGLRGTNLFFTVLFLFFGEADVFYLKARVVVSLFGCSRFVGFDVLDSEAYLFFMDHF